MHPEMEIYRALDQIDSWLGDHEHNGVTDITINVACPCGDTILKRTVEEFENDQDVKPACRCLTEEWFEMECTDCKHHYSVPEHQVKTTVCPQCAKVAS